jgi:hypothetical protein
MCGSAACQKPKGELKGADRPDTPDKSDAEVAVVVQKLGALLLVSSE